MARRNQEAAGIARAEFLRGHIEAFPLPDASVDVVVSNCVIGLSPDKGAVFGEAYRVLRPGGRLALADAVADAEADPDRRQMSRNWATCLAGCLTRAQYRSALEEAGFVGISLEESHPVGEGFTSRIVRGFKPTVEGPLPKVFQLVLEEPPREHLHLAVREASGLERHPHVD